MVSSGALSYPEVVGVDADDLSYWPMPFPEAFS